MLAVSNPCDWQDEEIRLGKEECKDGKKRVQIRNRVRFRDPKVKMMLNMRSREKLTQQRERSVCLFVV